MATLGVPIICYAATGKDIFRKPCIGMFEHFMKHQVLDHTLNKNESFFVGDAAGRIAQGKTATDFSCSDRKFAHNAGLPFHTPEAFFLNEVERSFAWTKDGAFDAPSYITTAETPGIPGLSEQELVLMVAPPAAGKTTFFQRHFAPLGYIRINQDKLGTRDRCIKVAKEALQQGQRIVVDNTSPAIATRAEWIVLCRSLNVKIRCIELQTPIAIARHNNAYRALTQPVQDLEKRTLLPDTAFIRFTSAYQEPTVEEGFVEVLKVPFVPDAERPEWRRFFF
jgi:bifunctional polynucleotide phosphatase/kinase